MTGQASSICILGSLPTSAVSFSLTLGNHGNKMLTAAIVLTILGSDPFGLKTSLIMEEWKLSVRTIATLQGINSPRSTIFINKTKRLRSSLISKPPAIGELIVSASTVLQPRHSL